LTSKHVERRLTAIVAADFAGYVERRRIADQSETRRLRAERCFDFISMIIAATRHYYLRRGQIPKSS
jgi:hypothetical protein